MCTALRQQAYAPQPSFHVAKCAQVPHTGLEVVLGVWLSPIPLLIYLPGEEVLRMVDNSTLTTSQTSPFPASECSSKLPASPSRARHQPCMVPTRRGSLVLMADTATPPKGLPSLLCGEKNALLRVSPLVRAEPSPPSWCREAFPAACQDFLPHVPTTQSSA